MRTALTLSAAFFLTACASGLTRSETMMKGADLYATNTCVVTARTETDGMPDRGDAADDPAVWVSPADPAKSRILGTNKQTGLYVYGLDGGQLQFLPVGRTNNVDIRGTLAVGSNDEVFDDVGGLSWFRIDPLSAEVAHLGDTPVGKVEPYGVCLGDIGGEIIAGTTYKDGTVQLWALRGKGDAFPAAELVRTVKLGSKLEGCVFDDAANTLFIGEEEVGIWKLDLADPASTPVSVDTIAAGNGLVADVEGISLWEGPDGTGFLLASAQAADRFVVYDRAAPHTPRGVFSVGETASIDAVSHTDGLDVVSTPLPGYPQGLLVVQDDANPASEVAQNFKLVSWADVMTALGLE